MTNFGASFKFANIRRVYFFRNFPERSVGECIRHHLRLDDNWAGLHTATEKRQYHRRIHSVEVPRHKR